jgi:large subunit ribosomal protein L25
MAESIKMKAELKEKNGKGTARALRREGRIPAIIYGGSHKEVMISLAQNEFIKEYNKGNIQAKLFEIELANETITAIPKIVQVHPVTDFPLHADFQEVSKDTTVKVSVHVKVINEEKSPGVKRGGVLNVATRSFLVYCHPTNIPEHIVVDVINLEIGKNIHINDLELPQGVVPLDQSNFVVVSVSGRSESTEETSAAEAPTA